MRRCNGPNPTTCNEHRPTGPICAQFRLLEQANQSPDLEYRTRPELAGITDFVSGLQPDLCILQEVDLNAKRTGRRHLADQLAARFEFNYVFGVEFEELSQGSKTERAYHGQAVFARYPILAPRILRFSQQSDRWRPRWFLPRWPVFQPRRRRTNGASSGARYRAHTDGRLRSSPGEPRVTMLCACGN